ncbi:hypothetical protein H8E88_15235 [candidate division KSB1 bacterium]|nr:hypothetical protein [candidate division KSB1 bacterium]MBL7092783.1 hypothetical protein [candidate division KSB1 bacterium]
MFEDMEQPYLFGYHTYWQACIAAHLGEKKKAVNLLREALSQGAFILWFHNEIDLEPLWEYPEFRKLLKPKG